ncbi:MAG TPA: xanthine dehydrogenase family protein molybdopterin-binding subunit, partial [Planctomycetes bacterium]|nr:xanthine dehydrogenase family protein molybdopterin-binding subunit [Planctomycetota bacterium]
RKGWDPTDLDIRAARVIKNDGSDTGLSFQEACALMDDDAIEVLKARPRRNYAGFSDTNAGVQAAEVEVDMDTGVVRVKKVVAVADAGKLINPLTAESQVRGGVTQGVSYALHERRIMDRQKGRMLNDDLENYKILGSVDCPEIDVVLIDVYNGKSNTQVMGLGEPPIVATAAAVANAVADAIGTRIFEIPITPKKVLEAIAKKNAPAGGKTKKGARL